MEDKKTVKKENETTKDLLIKHIKEDRESKIQKINKEREEILKEKPKTAEHHHGLLRHELNKEEKEENEFKSELLGQNVEVKNKKELSKFERHPLINGFKFLSKSFATQWRMLLSVMFIFLIIVFALATITYFVQLTDEFGFHTPSGTEGTAGASEYLTFIESLWWVFITISTVGFGDIYPLTTFMRVWAMFIGVIGIVFVSLFTAVVVNGFAIEMQKNLEKRNQRLMKTKNKKDDNLLFKRMKVELDEKKLEVEELKWALAKLSNETIESIEEAMEHAREHAMEYNLTKNKKNKKNSKNKKKK